jgi:hypothetical protein
MKTTKPLLGLLIITAALSMQVHAQSFLTNGLEAYYPFNGNANDASGNGNNGLVNGAALTADRFGAANSAYRFNGTSWIQLPDAVEPAQPSGLTVSAWVLADSGANSGGAWLIHLSSRTGEGGMAIWNGGSWGVWVKLQNSQGYSANQDTVIPSVWTHIVAVYTQGQYVEFWVNGSLVQSNAIPNSPLYTDPSFPLNSSIGNYDYAPGPYNGFTGAMDDVRIYNRALSASEVQQLYAYESQRACTPSPAGLVSWWRGDMNALDTIGGNNGTLVNGASFAPGEVQEAFSFNGTNSYVEVPDSPALRLTNELTIEFWLKRQTLTPPTPEYFVEKGGDYTGGEQNYAVAVGSPTINNFLHFTCAGAWWGAGPINDLNWHHYAVTARNGDSAPQIYVDGVLQVLAHHGGASLINLHSSTRPLHIGAQVDPVTGWYYYSKTLIDELGLYNRVLAGAEIQAIYNAGSAGKCLSAPPPSTNCAPPSSDMVSWWRGEGNAWDQVGANNGVLVNGVGFDASVVGQAFRFNTGSNNYVEVADSPTLRLTNALTIECWAKRLNTSEVHMLVAKGGTWNGGQADYHIGLNDTYSGGSHFGFGFGGGWRGCAVTPDTAWHHYAAVAVSGQADPILYIDGVSRTITLRGGPATMTLSSTARPLRLGALVDTQSGWLLYSSTLIDEPSIYGRALSAAEIQAIYNASSLGKCASNVGPAIIVQPASLTVFTGASVTFAVTAAGTPPLSYQWQFNSAPIPGATANSLVLTNLQDSRAGSYQVVVSNRFGSVTSSNAVLAVLPAPPCATPPVGLVSWWSAEGNARDAVARNNGTLQGRATFSPGMVGQAFNFNPASGTVLVPDSPSLRLTNQLTIEGWINTRGTNTDYGIVSKVGGAAGNNGYQFGLSGNKLLGQFNSPGQSWPSSRIMYALPIALGVWHHVAWTYDQSAMKLYFNGQPVATNVIGARPIVASRSSLRISGDDNNHVYFDGLIDEVAIYDRALSAEEIAGIYSAGSTGKCGLAPAVQVPPESQTVECTSNVTFSVAATGMEPLAYQWFFGSDPAPGATTATLTLGHVSPAQAGSYSVVITNAYGTTVGGPAALTIVDTTPPTVSCPDPKAIEFQDETGAVATYIVTAADRCSAVNLLATPPSGSLFPIGTTRVSAQAMDWSGNQARCDFAVTVLGAQGVKSNVLAELVAVRASSAPRQPFAHKFDDAIQHLADSLNPAYWIDQTHLQAKGGTTAMNEEKLAVERLREIMDSKKCPVALGELQGFIDRIMKCDRLLAVIRIEEAARAGLNPKKVAGALETVAKGDAKAAAGHYANAIEHYRDAWRQAGQLRLQVSLNPDGSTRVQFVGDAGMSYRVEMSTDMVRWLPVGTCTADDEGNVEFTDPNTAGQPVRFYRAVGQ